MATRQRIFPTRRSYNQWVANQTLEDFALRFTAKSARLPPNQVALTALGSISFLALEAIGGAITLNYGFTNATLAILAVCLTLFLIAIPICRYAARAGVDVDLLTRGAGFGYLGSTITSLIYASFTFIFFALEAAIMAMALEVLFDIPLSLGYILSSLVIIPIVTHGITYISRFQRWTQPLWIVLQLTPFLFILLQDPGSMRRWFNYEGLHGNGHFDLMLFGASSTVIFSLVAQIGEQVDFLRFLPPREQIGKRAWWGAMLVGGPGWTVVGALKALAGSFLAVLAIQQGLPLLQAQEPINMYLVAFSHVPLTPWILLILAGLFVVLSQLKINVTNAYAGSIAWSNFFSRLTHNHPGRVVWLIFNVMIALLLMEIGIYRSFESILGGFAVIAVSWVGALVADLVVNKPLGLSPRNVEFRRAYLYDINPVGFGAMILATLIGLAARAGLWGEIGHALACYLALGSTFITAPLLALLTQGRYYIARPLDNDESVRGQPCCICEHTFDREDMAFCPAYNAAICSLCCSLDARCHSSCKHHARFQEQMMDWLDGIVPRRLLSRLRSRMGHFLVLLALVTAAIASLLVLVYYQIPSDDPGVRDLITSTLAKTFIVLVIISGIVSWLFVLAHESRVVAQEESNRQTLMLMEEIEAHERTDRELQKAKERAEAANQAKSRYLTGLSHELRSPLNAAYGYAQLLENDPSIPDNRQGAVGAIRRSTEHLSDLIEGLLEISKIEAGRLELYRNQVRIRALIEELVSMFRLQAQEKGIGFEFQRQGPLPEWVTTDEKRLRQVLINLLSNAIKFTNQGQVTLLVRYRSQVAEFTIRDTGVGIDADDLERVFRPFERVRKPGVPDVHGTGLGLTITRLLTDIMGGDIQVTSTPGKGSEFRLSVMLSSLYHGHHPAQMEHPIDSYIGPPRSLLVVDDDATHRGLISDMLTPLGFQIIEAPDGHTGLQLWHQSQPDLILLDVAMPLMDGWEMASILRRQGYDGPLVMLSANAQERQPQALSGSLHDDYLIKPFKRIALLDILARHLKLTWRHRAPEHTPPGPHVTPPRSISTATLHDEALRDELIALAEVGHLSGLRDKIHRIREAGLLDETSAYALDSALERFDFRELIRLLDMPS